MANELQGKKIAFLATDMVEQVELTEPWQALEQARAELEQVERGDSDADRWQLEQRIKHAENQLAVSGRG